MLSTAYERPCKLSAPKSIFPSMASLTTCRLADLPEILVNSFFADPFVGAVFQNQIRIRAIECCCLNNLIRFFF